MHCTICGGTDFTLLDSYKHTWLWCKSCGTVYSERKTKYPAETLFPERLARLFTPKLAMNVLYRSIPDSYDRYAELCKKGIEYTRWASWPKYYTDLFRLLRIDLSDKSILDISGGPGFLTKELSKKCKRAVVTEYSQTSVDAMSKVLGIEAVRYDYNSDRLEDLIDGKFDVVLDIGSLNFCKDLPKFVESLKRVMAQDGVVIADYPQPSLGMCIRWQDPDYTHLALYRSNVVAKVFVQHGFRLEKERQSCDPYMKDVLYQTLFARDGRVAGGKRKIARAVLTLPLIKLYLRKAKLKHLNVNQDLRQTYCEQVFRFRRQ